LVSNPECTIAIVVCIADEDFRHPYYPRTTREYGMIIGTYLFKS